MLSPESVAVRVLLSPSSSSSPSGPAPAEDATECGGDGVAIEQLLEGVAEVSIEVGVDDGVEGRVQIPDPKEEINDPLRIARDQIAAVGSEIDRVPEVEVLV